MKPTLQLKIGQNLTMTPQLQQAIRLLQLSTLELQNEIQEALESNPMLEMSEDSDDSGSNGEDSQSTSEENQSLAEQVDQALSKLDGNNKESDATDATAPEDRDVDLGDKNDMPEDLPVDSAWDDVYQSSGPASSGPAVGGDDDINFDDRNSAAGTLYDHLMWQLNLTPMTERDQAIAIAILEGIDDKGYLRLTLQDLVETMNADEVYEDPEQAVEEDEVQAVLTLIQQFDPPGIGARDLAECLLIQLHQLPNDTPSLAEARLIIQQYMDLLGNRDYNQLMRKSKLKEDQLRDAIKLIQSLTPYPGEDISPSDTEYVVPDVIVRKDKDRWLVELNPEATPKLRINAGYASMVQRADSSSDNTFLKNNLQEARWFLKSLQSRNETLLKVASKIVEFQKGFFEYGEEAMKPLVLHDIAEAVDMHESTISRVTTQKYMYTPRGIFELKYFFSSHVSTTSGGECSSTAIRAIIKKLVAAEDPKKPLSDSKIANLLAEQQIKVARRTIAKYRESLSIPPSNERKRLV